MAGDPEGSAEALLGLVLDQLPVVLFATDRDGVIRIARGKGAVRLGQDAVGRSAFELFKDAPRVVENLRRALAGEAFTTEGENDAVWWETRYMPLRGAGGEVTGVVGVTMDATARKRAEEELKKANVRLRELDSLKARFVANVSHELRTPLALVLGLTGHMRDVEGERGRHARDLASVEHNARLLLKHVNDLLDVAKLDAGCVRPDYAAVDLARLVSLAASPFDVVASERGLAFTLEVPASLPAAPRRRAALRRHGAGALDRPGLRRAAPRRDRHRRRARGGRALRGDAAAGGSRGERGPAPRPTSGRERRPRATRSRRSGRRPRTRGTPLPRAPPRPMAGPSSWSSRTTPRCASSWPGRSLPSSRWRRPATASAPWRSAAPGGRRPS